MWAYNRKSGLRLMSASRNTIAGKKDNTQNTIITVVEKPAHLEGAANSEPVAHVKQYQDTEDKNSAALFMLSAFMIEAVQWSLGTSYGVFYRFYTDEIIFSDDRFLTTTGTLAVGLPFLGAPLATCATSRWRHSRRWMIFGGWVVCLAGIVGASFATEAWHIVVTQGAVYGVGFLVLYYPMLDMLNEWFVKRRGLAYGILGFAANGLGGAVLPLILNKLLNRYGFRTVLRIYAVAIVVLTGPFLPLLKGRSGRGRSTTTTTSKHLALSLPTDLLFWILIASSFFQAIAFYVPIMYLPAFATAIDATTVKSALLLSLLNVATIIGQVAFGWLSDRVDVFLILACSTITSGIVTATLWLLARNFACLAAYSVLYGGAAGGFSVLYARFVTAISTDLDRGLWLYGLLAFVRGVSYVISGPISGAMLPAVADNPSDYRLLIACVAGSLIVSALGGLGTSIRPVPHAAVGGAVIVEDAPAVIVRSRAASMSQPVVWS